MHAVADAFHGSHELAGPGSHLFRCGAPEGPGRLGQFCLSLGAVPRIPREQLLHRIGPSIGLDLGDLAHRSAHHRRNGMDLPEVEGVGDGPHSGPRRTWTTVRSSRPMLHAAQPPTTFNERLASKKKLSTRMTV